MWAGVRHVALLLLLLLPFAQAVPSAIILIVADDLGYNDLGFTNANEILTPNLDALSSEGVRLSNYMVQPVCSPSRAAIMTGRYPIAYGLQTYVVEDGADYGVNLNETFLPEVLRDYGGFQTHAVGKWHLGMSSWNYTPTFRGFDSFYGYYTGFEDYFNHSTGVNAFDLHNDTRRHCGHNCSQVAWSGWGTYSTHMYTQQAIEVINAHDAAKGPLFLYLAYQAVHSPAEVPASYIWPYNNTIADPERRKFAGMVACLDEGVGNVTAALKARGILDTSLLIFTTDNGGAIRGGPTECPICNDAIGSSNKPLRGGKHSVWLGGTLGTAFVRAPSLIQGASTTRHGIMHISDWFPTVISVAGITNYTQNVSFPLHSVDQWAMISQPSAPSVRQEVLLNIDPYQNEAGPYVRNGGGNAGIRVGDWVLLLGAVGPPDDWSPDDVQAHHGTNSTTVLMRQDDFAEWVGSKPLWPISNQTLFLYNMTADISQNNNVAALYPAVVAQLMGRLNYWATEVMVPPLFCFGNCTDPRSHPALHNGTWVPWVPSQ